MAFRCGTNDRNSRNAVIFIFPLTVGGCDAYEAMGTQNIWVVNPERRKGKVSRRGNWTEVTRFDVEGSEAYLNVDCLFAQIDSLTYAKRLEICHDRSARLCPGKSTARTKSLHQPLLRLGISDGESVQPVEFAADQVNAVHTGLKTLCKALE